MIAPMAASLPARSCIWTRSPLSDNGERCSRAQERAYEGEEALECRGCVCEALCKSGPDELVIRVFEVQFPYGKVWVLLEGGAEAENKLFG